VKRILALLVASGLALALLTLGITKEVPIGSISGKVTLEENGRAMPHALVVVTPEHPGDDYDWADRNWHARTASDGTFAIRSIPAGDYRVEVVAQEHSLKESIFTVTEGHSTPMEIRLAPNGFHLQMYLSQKVLAPRAPAHIDLSGFVGDKEVSFELRKLQLSAVAKENGVSNAVQPVAYQHQNLDSKHLDAFSDRVSLSPVEIVDKDIEGAFEKKVELPLLPEGLYIGICRAGSEASAVFINVTKIALVAKNDVRGLHCFVTDIDTGQPIPHAELLLPDPASNEYKAATKTDRDGLAVLRVKGQAANATILARVGDSIAVTDFRDLSNQGGGEEEQPEDPNIRVFTYADRPVYRPGDTIQFKAIVRRLHGTELRLPGPGVAKIEVYDPNEGLLEEQTLPLSSHGTLHGSFSTLAEAAPGVYRIEVHALGGVDHYYANLAAYRKPDFSIKVTGDKRRYCIGDTASATVECQYFFGGPVVGAKITASIYRSPVWDDFEEEEDSGQQGDDESSGGEFVQDVKAVTDGLGHATIRFPTTSGDQTSGESPNLYDYQYSVQVSIEEEGGQSFEGNGSVLVSRGNVRLTASTDPFIASPGDSANLSIKTVSEDQPPHPVANRPVRIEISQETFTRHTTVSEPIQTLDLSTGPDGTLNVPLKIGHTNDLQIAVSTTDELGHKVATETTIDVEGGHDADWGDGPEMKVRVDRAKYKVGDRVKAMIQTKSPGGVAFLTVQADDIKMTRLVHLTSGSTIVTFPLTRAMAPNAFVHVAYVHGRKYWDADREITVDRPDRHLQVSVQPSVSKALPGSPVTFLIQTKDKSGAGVPAEVSLGVVDESIYTIKPDSTDIVAGLFPDRIDAVETTYSFPEIFLDGGDKAGGSVPVRRKFLDTASWTPTVETDASGRGRVTVRLPDNLTSWRATAVAATDDSQVGMATANVRASKPLMVRVEAPPFMVAGDRQEIAVAVTNDSGADAQVQLDFNLQDVTVGDAAKQSLHLAQGETGSVLLDTTAAATGSASLVATARSDHGETDAVEAKWPVLPHGRLVISQQSGIVAAGTQLNFNALPNRDLTTGGLEVTISPSVMSGMLQSLDSLVQFPYGCVEQTMSRFLPAVLVAHAIKGSPVDRASLQTKVAAISADGFARLQKMQHEDGAWGWWSYDESDPFMTAWVLDGLKRSDRAGYPTPPNLSTEKTVGWAVDRLKTPFKDDSLRSRIYLAYAVAQYGKAHEARAALQGMNLTKAGEGDLALAVLAGDESGEDSIKSEATDRLLSALDERPGMEEGWFFWNEGESESLALLALEKVRPEDPHIPVLVRELNEKRGCDGWDTTRESSLAIAALCTYLERNPENLSPSRVEISLNGNKLKTVAFDSTTSATPDFRLEIPVAKLLPGVNQLTLNPLSGQPCFAYELRQYDVEETLPMIMDGKDLQVERRYYRLEPHQLPDGTQKLLPSDRPISSARTGDIIRCEITVRSSKPMDYLMIEDPIPSNMRVTDREDPGEDGKWSYWWSSLVIRDDRVSLFANYMPKGEHKLSYVMRAEGHGTSCALPTRAELMYRPDVNASADGFNFQVNP
jgi:uncharacterized protein YfaS (alpha-2-macroglobulin family)